MESKIWCPWCKKKIVHNRKVRKSTSTKLWHFCAIHCLHDAIVTAVVVAAVVDIVAIAITKVAMKNTSRKDEL